MSDEEATEVFHEFAKLDHKNVQKVLTMLGLQKFKRDELLDIVDTYVMDGSACPNHSEFLKIYKAAKEKQEGSGSSSSAGPDPEAECREWLLRFGASPMAINQMLMCSTDLPFWEKIWETYGDLGGNVQVNGIRVRTPWAGAPPHHWSGGPSGDDARKRYLMEIGGLENLPALDDSDGEEY